MGPKIITFYLPQFHEIPENNRWWGKGFTEWDRVKNAKPLFLGHHQPRKPYKYYDLSDIDVLKDQTKMAKRFGVDGFCYYHYWFNGKKLLEKPLESMLARKDIDMPFCLSWANEPWTRAWEGNSSEVLMPQNYGDESDWIQHLDYLLPFFEDERYLRIDDKPIFIIYRTESFSKFDEMILFWEEKIKMKGIKGLFIVETLNSYQKKPKCNNSDAVIEFEPLFSSMPISNRFINSILSRLHRIKNNSSYRAVHYDHVWEKIIKRNKKYKKIRFLGAFVDWDNTPRFRERSTIYIGATPAKFKKYLMAQAKKCNGKDDIIFINAWNEWAEGAYLEPDSQNGYGYLESMLEVKKSIALEKV